MHTPELQEGALAYDILVFCLSEKPCELGQLGVGGGGPHITHMNREWKLSSPLLSGSCSSPPQDPDFRFKVVFLSDVRVVL